jgi:hypothetical protein
LRHPITCDRYEAVLFDMDGVVTDTVSIHATCWKTMFDEFLQKWAMRNAEPFRSFDDAFVVFVFGLGLGYSLKDKGESPARAADRSVRAMGSR